MRVGDPACDREAQARAARAVARGAREAGERLEDPLPLGLRDAGALVVHVDHDVAAGPPDADGDRRRRRASGRWRCRPGSAAAGRAGRGPRWRAPDPAHRPRAPRRARRRGRWRPGPCRRRARRRRAAPARRVSCVSSHAASWSRSPTRPPSRSASAMTSDDAGRRPSSATSPSRSSTSALARIRAAGVRSSCEASATNRRWASKPSRIGTSARPVTRSVITAAATSPARPDREDREDQASVTAGRGASGRSRPGRSPGRPPSWTSGIGQQADVDAAGARPCGGPRRSLRPRRRRRRPGSPGSVDAGRGCWTHVARSASRTSRNGVRRRRARARRPPVASLLAGARQLAAEPQRTWATDGGCERPVHVARRAPEAATTAVAAPTPTTSSVRSAERRHEQAPPGALEQAVGGAASPRVSPPALSV